MGVTISYRGSLGDLDRVEDFEDRVLDLALELGGQATIWRTASDDGPKKGTVPICRNGPESAGHKTGQSPFSARRMVRGVILNLFPGQEPTSLLIAPEGWLINLTEIEEAEKGQLREPPWCFVKTQFGPIEGHVALVELLTTLKQEFFPDLEVIDEGGYWETRDLAGLTEKFKFLRAAMDAFCDGLQRYGLSEEAAEDQEILASRIERIAQLVHRTMARPAEHPPVRLDDEADDTGDEESKWDALYKENRRRQEHLQRAIEEHLADGDNLEEALDAAMNEETAAGLPAEPSEEETDEWNEELQELEGEEDEPWRESLTNERGDGGDDDGDFVGRRPRHPLQRRAFDLMLRLHDLLNATAEAEQSHRDVLMHGAIEIVGGLAQALGPRDLEPLRGLSLVQLKRALRGAAFAQGALYPLRANGTLDKAAFDELHETIDALQTDIYAELARQRQPGQGDA